LKFNMFTLPTVPGTYEERVSMRPIGRNRERVAQMYDELVDLCVAADQAGFDSFSTTEHHFHSEGYEVSAGSLVLYAHMAAKTTNIKFAPLGVVLPTWDPIRLAEEIAVLDQLSKGRVYIGLARGYQSRWTDVLGQSYNVHGATMDGSEVDLQNREVFDEVFDIMIKAWTEESFKHDGKYYKVPNPVDGIEWKMAELSKVAGAPREIDPVTGKVVEISVVPPPFQDPHPPLWQGYAASKSTIESCAKRGITPFCLISRPDEVREWTQMYQQVAAEFGRNLGVGEGVGMARAVSFGDTFEEAFELGVKTTGVIFSDYFARFGFTELFRREGDPEAHPLDLGGPRALYQRMYEDGHAICGTPDQVKRQVEADSNCHGVGKLEHFSWSNFTQGLTPRSVQEQQLELFHKHLITEFAD
jgi:alkanesulfonate monooxygenase SsuD/methylene tetrahydromethanopterin reductase-like flavin-dependent oxidoreductase (luciferase family)